MDAPTLSASDDSPAGTTLAAGIPAPMALLPFLELASRAALALAALHQRGVLHGSLTPRAFAVDTATGAVTLVALPPAAPLPRDPLRAERPQLLAGALAHMSPEQTGRMNRRIDERSDLYSLGVIFYELLTGRPPLSAGDALGWVHAHVAVTPAEPRDLVPSIPGPVSAIVMRLLAKAPEDRYESALGLKLDLDRCLEGLAETGAIAPFPLGERDGTGRLSVPQKLYGRERELAVLTETIDRLTAVGRAEFVVVSGYAGIGKSSLIQELQRPLLRARGLFVSGKCDQVQRGVPYATLVLAFRELIEQILAESDAALAALRARLQGALGNNGRLIVDVLPEVKLILGEQPALVELGPVEAQNRFRLVFQDFIRAVGQRDRPLIVFLDDLQWADEAMLDLLAVLAADPELRHIGFILAYRSNEVGEAHPLASTLQQIERAGATLRRVELAPLDLPSVTALVADTLRATPGQALPLAQVVCRKTAGNPFFAGVFLKALHQEGLLTYDQEARAFRWEMARIEAKAITENVVDLLLERLKRLPEETRRALTLAAAIGASFALDRLAAVAGKPLAEVEGALLPALKDELITSAGAAYLRAVPRDPEAASAVYRFEHDRIQQAAYSLLDEDLRRAVHLALGRMLLAARAEEREARLFEIVHHLRLGLGEPPDPADRRLLRELSAAAGRRAKAGAAHAPARGFLRAAQALSSDDAWTTSYAETFALHCDLAECEYLTGDHAAAEGLLDAAFQKARDLLDQGRIVILRLMLYESSGRAADGLAAGLAGLRLFGVETPATPQEIAAATAAARAAFKERLGGRSAADLLDAPLMPDGAPKVLTRLIAQLTIFTFMARSPLHPLIALKGALLSLEHGNALHCSRTYLTLSTVEGFFFGDMDAAYAFSTLALRVCERLNDVRSTPAALFVHGAMLSPWREPYGVALKYMDDAYHAALSSGDFAIANYAGHESLMVRFLRGDTLESIAGFSTKCAAFALRSWNTLFGRQAMLIQGFLRELRGQGSGASQPLGASLGEGMTSAQLIQSGEPIRVALYSLLSMILAYVFGRPGEALAHSEAVKALLVSYKGRFGEVLYCFYRALSLAALHPAAAPGDQRRYREEIGALAATFERWADRCPDNFRAQHLLLRAEIARLDGQPMEALSGYEAAARAAQETGLLQHEALASELAGKLFLELALERSARAHLTDACVGYRAFGAEGKARSLEEAYPALLSPRERSSPAGPSGGDSIDLLAVFGAARAISGEIDRDRLLRQLMTITLQSAAAEEGCLLGVKGDEFIDLARASVNRGAIEVTVRGGHAGAVEPGVPASILHYVARTRSSVVLADASRDPRFAADPRITPSRPRSVLCLPLLRQAELIGVLYLENNLAPGAFTREQTAVLELLASQAAISLENATLYTELRQENAERRRAEGEVRALNSELERRVAERTAALEIANQELEAFSYSVSHDLQAPLRSISGHGLALLEDYGPSLDPTAQGYIAEVRAGSQRMTELIDDMLKLARISRAELSVEELDLTSLAEEVADVIQRTASQRAVTWVIAQGVRARGDPGLLKIALENLLGNAFKFTSKRAAGRIAFGVKDDPSSDKGDKVYFVGDNGAGFDMRRADRLFRPFKRLHRESDFTGTGVGLATVQRIIHRHGGRVWAEGAVDQGATFYFTLAR